MEMSPQLARLVAWLEEMHARVMQAEQAALAVMDDMPAYTARMQEKARLLASLEEEGEAYLEELPEQLQDQAGHRLHRFSASARNALRIGSIFYMSALLYPEDHKPGHSSGACVTKANTIPCTRRTSGQFFPGAGGRPGPRAKVPPSPAPSFPQRALAGRMMIPAALRPSPDAGLPVEDFGKSAASPPPSLW